MEYIILALAILQAGGCLVPIAEELTDDERAEIVARTGLCGVVLGRAACWEISGSSEKILSSGAKWSGFSFCEIEVEEEFAKLNPAFIRFSSGTTGRSKGVVLSHEKLLERITAANAGLEINRSDRVLWMLPMAHHFAVSVVLYLYHGACTVLAKSSLAKDVISLAEKSSATVMYGSPYHYALLAADRSDFAWSSLRLAVSTAAPLPVATAENFSQRFGKNLVQGLGIIEVGFPLMNHTGTHAESIGRPLPAYEIEIRDEHGPVGDGSVGELWIRGPGMFDAYLSPWQPVADVCQNGWFSTGDLASESETGLVTLRGRKKSVLIVGGMKVFPEEVEAILHQHPAVKLSRVTGLPHEIFGTVPVAEVVLHRQVAAKELLETCKQALSAYKVPVRIKFVEEIETTASGKVRRV